jgi:hypothetical protein
MFFGTFDAKELSPTQPADGALCKHGVEFD